MDDIVSPIATPVVESLKKHVDFLVSSTQYVEDMKKKMEQLNVIEQDIRESGPVESNRKRKWLEDVKSLSERSNSIEATGLFNVAKRYKVGKQSYRILKEIEDLKTQTSEIQFTNDKKSLAASSSTSISVPHDTHNSFKSRDLLFKDALKALQPNNESQKMIALCGMGGVGKTTMMEQLRKAVKDSNMFDWVVKVVIGENNDPIALQQSIAEYINKDLTETNQDARADRLRQKFEEMSEGGQKKILVIMDDVWKEVDLKDVGLSPLPSRLKLMFTSRDEFVCTRMGVRTDSIFKVRVLSDVEAKDLFFRTVEAYSFGDDPELQKIGEQIVKKCGGLPIAIITIAKSLSGNITEAWQQTLRRLEKDDLQDLEHITHRIFEMSYENLKENPDKSFFLLCGLFPDDFDIRREYLLRYGWGLGFFKNVKNLAEARSGVKICINNLIRANLLTESEHAGCVKMHDLVRAFALSNFSKVKQASIVISDKSGERLAKDANESYDRILLKCTGMTKFTIDFNYPNLSMLMLRYGFEHFQFPEDIYARMEKLQVVSYANMHIPSHVFTFEHSNKLRTLCLYSCLFMNDDVSFLGSLSNLETLSFAYCRIRRLPSTIGELKKLKLLDLTGCQHLCIDDGVFENLNSLEELYMRAWNDCPIRFTKENCEELEMRSRGLHALELEFYKNKAQPKNMSFTILDRFRISIGCKLVEPRNLFRNTIQFVGDYNELLECKISDLIKKTEELHLEVNEMNKLELVSTNNSFSNLTVLHISKCADIKYLFTVDVASGLKKLERLTISECPIMRTLVAENSRVGVIRFQKLSFMSLVGLPKMEGFWDNVIELPEMVELILDDLPNFTSICPDSHDTFQMNSLLNKKVMIPKLKELAISRMVSLKQIWSSETTTEKNNVSMLRMLKVRNCDNLMNLFPCNPLPLLSHLEELEVQDCGSIEVLFNIDFDSVYEIGESDSCRLRSIAVDQLGKLKELWRMKGVNNSEVLISCFKGVESIKINKCSIFKHIFTPTTSNFDLRALTNYNTNDTGEENNAILKGGISEMDDNSPNVPYPSYLLQTCHHLQHLILQNDERVEDVVFEMDSQLPLLLPYLKDLELYDLKKMTHVWKCNWNKFLISQHQPLHFPFQNLTNIYVRNCHKIKYLFSPLMAEFLSNLKCISIQKCDDIEEVASWRDDENEENTFTSSRKNTTFFRCLETIHLSDLALLNRVDGGETRSRSDTISSNITNTNHDQSQRCQVIGACWSLCQYPRTILIRRCQTLSILIPWYAVGQMKRLEGLEILMCKTLMAVFESERSSIHVDEGSAHGGTHTTLTSQTLKTVPFVVPQLSNLRYVLLDGCDRVSHVFTFSTLESLTQLKTLKVEKCKAIQVIVKEENGMSSKDVVFPRLETLELDNLPSLKAFFLGTNDFRWPSLDNVMISDCPQLVMFTPGESKTPKLKYIRTWLGKHSLECGLNFHGTINEFQTTFPSSSDLTISKRMPWSFHNLIEINLEFRGNVGTVIPSHSLPQLQMLQKICIKYSSINELFEVVASEGSDFNDSQTVVKIPNLTHVELGWQDDLKYLWKSNQWMVLEFPNLTTLKLITCHSLEHVFTCSMVASLVQLQDIHITRCDNIEVIVKEDEEKEYDGKVNEIMLPRLKSLKGHQLPKLKGFCLGKEDFSWPSLDTLHISDCPAFTVFTRGHLRTPKLKVMKTCIGMYYLNTDLNSFIKIKQEEVHILLFNDS